MAEDMHRTTDCRKKNQESRGWRSWGCLENCLCRFCDSHDGFFLVDVVIRINDLKARKQGLQNISSTPLKVAMGSVGTG